MSLTTVMKRVLLLIGLFSAVPLMANANQSEFWRVCFFDGPDQDNDCKVKIVQCVSTEPTDAGSCVNSMLIRCGDTTLHRGAYTQLSEDSSIRVIAGNPAPIGAPFVQHEVPTGGLPATVDAFLVFDSTRLDGHCRAFLRD